jgi:lipopolysaccharide transport system permease protein
MRATMSAHEPSLPLSSIAPARGLTVAPSWEWLRELVRYRDLLYMLTWRDIRVRYKQSVMGLLWAVLMPAAIVISGVVVRVAMARVAHQAVTLSDLTPVFVKSVAWAFFVSSIRQGTNSLIANSTLVTRIYFPRLVVPLSAVAANFFDFVVASCVLTVILACLGVTISVNLLWVPPILALLVLLTAGLAIFLSAAGLFFRDVKYLVEIFVMFAIFVTPVFFSASILGRWEWVLLINPVAPLLEGMADAIVLGQTPNLAWLSYSAAATLGIFGCALALFRRLEPIFAECA